MPSLYQNIYTYIYIKQHDNLHNTDTERPEFLPSNMQQGIDGDQKHAWLAQRHFPGMMPIDQKLSVLKEKKCIQGSQRITTDLKVKCGTAKMTVLHFSVRSISLIANHWLQSISKVVCTLWYPSFIFMPLQYRISCRRAEESLFSPWFSDWKMSTLTILEFILSHQAAFLECI